MIFEVDKVGFHYPTDSRVILDDVSLGLSKGQILSILGPNGSGKSTLLNCMAGLLTPSRGTIKLMGKDLFKLSPRSIAKTVAYVPQNHTPAFAYTVLDFVMMGRAPSVGLFQKPTEADRKIAWEALEALSISHLAEKSYIDISGGERQQATIARAIVQQPEAILFDEPTAHLDYGNQHRILRLIHKLADQGYGIIITTHNPDHALLLGGTASILSKNGKLITGSSKELITEEQLRSVYNTDLRLLYVEDLKRVACLPQSLSEETCKADAGKGEDLNK